MRFTAFLLVFLIGIPFVSAADAVSLKDRKRILEVNQAVGDASKRFAVGEFDKAGQAIRDAMNLIQVVGKETPELMPQLGPAITRIKKAHTMLEFEGVSLPPFVVPTVTVEKPKPKRVVSKKSKPTAKTPQPQTPKSPLPNPGNPDPLSFTQSVAPILANRCGRCHISGSKGQFNMKTFALLMKGPPEGVVIFPGDNVGSRLIETIETGDMPRGGGKVTPDELQTLKGWIAAGAKFDGTDPTVPLVGAATKEMAPAKPMQVSRATGNETVSFASDVAGLLVKNCSGCHIDAMQNQGGLSMNTFAQLLRGGDSGAIVQPGKSDDSLLVRKLRGMEGNRMPAGGRPPLSEDEIQLIATWIKEGATLDGANDSQPLGVMNQLAWAASATPEEMSQRRTQESDKNLKLFSAKASKSKSITTEHFHVVGTSSKATLELVGKIAEEQMKTIRGVVQSDEEGEAFYHGRVTIFAMPRRYDYSEFAKMVEQREVPSDWTSHWSFDGIDAYVAMVAGEKDDEEKLERRLVAPLTALAVANHGVGVPRWFSEGVGVVTATRTAKMDRSERRQLERETAEAFLTMRDAKSFLSGQMSPEHADRIGAAIATTLLDRKQRRNFDRLIRELPKGDGFDESFTKVFGANPEAFINAWMNYMRR